MYMTKGAILIQDDNAKLPSLHPDWSWSKESSEEEGSPGIDDAKIGLQGERWKASAAKEDEERIKTEFHAHLVQLLSKGQSG